MTLARIVQRQAESRPQSVAVRFGPLAVTYDEFARTIDGVATRLASEGVAPGVSVSMHVKSLYWNWVFLLAGMRAGAITITASRPIATVIATLGAVDFVITTDNVRESAAGRAKQIVASADWLDAARQTTPSLDLVDPAVADASMGRYFFPRARRARPKRSFWTAAASKRGCIISVRSTRSMPGRALSWRSERRPSPGSISRWRLGWQGGL